MIVVLDTNVWISGLHFGRPESAARRAVDLALERDTVALCSEMEAELIRVLHDKFGWSEMRCEETLSLLRERSVTVELSHRVRVCRDSKDDMFLECAEMAGAQMLVAGDKDLLVLGSYAGIRVVSPAEYVGVG